MYPRRSTRSLNTSSFPESNTRAAPFNEGKRNGTKWTSSPGRPPPEEDNKWWCRWQCKRDNAPVLHR
ncbi:hypothetical protein Nepgr_023500 [Nepenthes gracilis]|uniref:Uncharacterized protein n=1 Tax=Nepenthes gracilis TaxID=150966 RepID=A0AAD3XXX7_NEPGR|nr:hypothetical protein Nepgr_023500 [Nepenthes gracilis]